MRTFQNSTKQKLIIEYRICNNQAAKDMSKEKGGQKINTGALTDQDRKYHRRNKKTAKTLSSSTKILKQNMKI